jgi:hypothetical protein
MFSDYPNIVSPIYALNIEALEGNPDDSLRDDRIGITVSKILNLLFSKIENVIVYVCDSVDRRQYARKRKFDIWFYMYNDGSIIKEEGLALIEGVEIYNTLLIHKKNQQIKEIILAFKELNERANEK